MTRQHVLDTALALFRRQGFARTTMRDIADGAGLSLGAAYHYFPSKDALVLAYYDWMQAEHEQLVEDQRAPEADLKSRIATLFATKLELLRRDCKLLGALFGNLGDPTQPLSVFGRQTSDIRERSLAQFTAVFADPAVPDELRSLLGRLLWLAHLGIFLFFIHDNSPKQARTFKLVDALVDLGRERRPVHLPSVRCSGQAPDARPHVVSRRRARGHGVTNGTTPLAPFVAALGQALEGAAPLVRRHLAQADRIALHRGVIRRMWRRGPMGAIGGRLLHLESRPATDARFELRNEVVSDGRGGAAMLWQRTYYVNARPILGVGLLQWDGARRVLIDVIGTRKWLEVELTPTLDGRAVTMRSGRQWLRVLGLRLRLPQLLVGGARTREWEEPDGRLGLSLTLDHPLFGEYAGYEAVLTPEHAS